MALGLITLSLCCFLEACMRFSIDHGGWQRLANPGAYYDPTCQDEYWQMLHHTPGWKDSVRVHSSHEFDADLGWTVDGREKNKWGGWKSPSYPLRFDGKPIGVFGDSFVFSTTKDGARLPDYLAKEITEARILNYGVAGYGFDQIVLTFEKHAESLQGQQALIGVLTTDLDRSVLSVRSGPKPYFKFNDTGELSVQSAHIQENRAYFETHPVQPLSYLATYLRINIPRHWAVWVKKEPWNCKVDQKKKINAALFQRLKKSCETWDIDCSLIVFHAPERLHLRNDWRNQLIQDQAKALEFPLIDSAESLNTQSNPSLLYGPDRHPNASGNRIIAEQIAQALSTAQKPEKQQEDKRHKEQTGPE